MRKALPEAKMEEEGKSTLLRSMRILSLLGLCWTEVVSRYIMLAVRVLVTYSMISVLVSTFILHG